MLLLTALLAGCGSGSSSGSGGQSQAAGSVPAATTTARAAPKPSTRARRTTSTATSTPASTTTAKSSPPTSTDRAAPPVNRRLLHRFTGSGNARLGTIVVSAPEVLVWQARHPTIQIFAANGFILVSSGAASGSIHLSRGTYRGLRVATRAGWSIELLRPPAT
jgi:hypothetical protein